MRRFLFVTALLLCCCQAIATEVVAEGAATIKNGDVAGARELATRRAIASAVESKGAIVSGQTTILPGVALESVQVRATGCASQTAPLGEIVKDGEITVSVSVSVANGGPCALTCRRSTINRIAVTAFAIEFPERSPSVEGGSMATLTAVEMARFINTRQHLLAVYDSTYFPYASPSRAPEQLGSKTAPSLATAIFAQDHSSQYVLAGVYRDLGVSGNTRRIEIEAFLHDGATGSVLARRVFVRTGTNRSFFSGGDPIGSPQFYAGDPGRTFGAIFTDIAAWVESSAGCLPFIARVLKVKDGQLQIDAGAESGVSVGDTMSLHQWKEPPVRRHDQTVLGREKFVRTTVRIRSVYPNFSVGELVEAPAGLKVASGDVLYAE